MARGAEKDHLTRAGLNLIQQALSIYDRELRLAVSNRPFQTMFGLPEHLVTPGASFEETIRYLVEAGEYGEVGVPAAFIRDRVEAARAFVPHYMERRRANGRTISVEGSPLPGGGWVTVYTDITAVKRQEELLRGRSEVLSDQLLEHAEQLAHTNRRLEATIAQLEEAKRELTEMEARTRLTTEMTPAHIGHVDRERVYTFTNRRLATLLPDRGSDIVGLSFEDALGPVAHRLRPSLDRALAGEASVLEFTEPASGRRIRTAFTPDQVDAGQPINGVYLLSTDVTEEAQARAALAQTHKRELAAQLTSGLAHDFANLLTIILGLQGRLEKMDLPEGAKELIGATQTAARRGGLLLDKIARISGPIDMRPVPVVLRDFLDSFAPLAPRAPAAGHLLRLCLRHLARGAAAGCGQPSGQPAEPRAERPRRHRRLAGRDRADGPRGSEHMARHRRVGHRPPVSGRMRSNMRSIRSSRQRAKAARASACRWSTTWRSLPAGMCGSPTCRVAAPWSRCACP